MPEIYLASSVHHQEPDRKLEGVRTIRDAKRHNFDGVQLYLNGHYQDKSHRQEIIAFLAKTNLRVTFHLPNEPLTADLLAAQELLVAIPNSTALIHFSHNTDISALPAPRVGLENSLTGTYDPKHVRDTLTAARREGRFMVFDFARLMFAERHETELQQTILAFIRETISGMEPGDYLHALDKSGWETNFADTSCALGVGISMALINTLAALPGKIVLENQNLEEAVQGRDLLIRAGRR